MGDSLLNNVLVTGGATDEAGGHGVGCTCDGRDSAVSVVDGEETGTAASSASPIPTTSCSSAWLESHKRQIADYDYQMSILRAKQQIYLKQENKMYLK